MQIALRYAGGGEEEGLEAHLPVKYALIKSTLLFWPQSLPSLHLEMHGEVPLRVLDGLLVRQSQYKLFEVPVLS